jgi:hypothetical protein
MLSLHREIPTLSLPDARGRAVSTWNYKQYRPLVLVFAGSRTDLLSEFVRQYEAYRATNAEVLAVVTEAPDGPLPFPVLIDADGSATRRYVDRVPTVLVLDAFGVLEGRFDEERPDHTRVRNLIGELELRCPECGVPEWPAED